LFGLDPKFLFSASQPSINRSPQNFQTSLMWDQALKTTIEKKIFSPKNFVWEKCHILPTVCFQLIYSLNHHAEIC